MKNAEFTFSPELLKSLHLLTVDGKLNHDANRKLKQIEHLCQFFKPILESYVDQQCTLVDVGAGKSYLGFLLFDKFLKDKSNFSIIGIESRKELIAKSLDLAKKLQFSRMNFIPTTVETLTSDPSLLPEVHIVTALHACDTATDEAIKLGLSKNAQYFVLIPCCQAEVAKTLKNLRGPSLESSALTQLYRHPLHTREFGSHLTNVLRCLLLESKGYQISVTEFTGLEHSLKNELIIAKKIQSVNNKAKQALTSLIATLGLESLNFRFNY